MPFVYWHLGDSTKDSKRAACRDLISRLPQEVPGLRGAEGIDAISLGDLRPDADSILALAGIDELTGALE